MSLELIEHIRSFNHKKESILREIRELNVIVSNLLTQPDKETEIAIQDQKIQNLRQNLRLERHHLAKTLHLELGQVIDWL